MADFVNIYLKGDKYHPKFHCDPYGIYMFAGDDTCDDNIMVLDCHNDDSGCVLRSLCNYLNGNIPVFQPRIIGHHKDTIILETGWVIRARGWGYLTGVKHLSNEEAAKVQDDFIKWVVDRINGSFFEQQERAARKMMSIAKPRPTKSIAKAKERKNKPIEEKLRELNIKVKHVKK